MNIISVHAQVVNEVIVRNQIVEMLSNLSANIFIVRHLIVGLSLSRKNGTQRSGALRCFFFLESEWGS